MWAHAHTCSQLNTYRRRSHGWGRRWVVITPVPLPPQSSPLLSFCSTTFLSASGFHYKDIKLKSRRGDKVADWRAWVMTVYSTAVTSLHAGLFHIASRGKREGPNINTNPPINAPQTVTFCLSVSLSASLCLLWLLTSGSTLCSIYFTLQTFFSPSANLLCLPIVTSAVAWHQATDFTLWHGSCNDTVPDWNIHNRNWMDWCEICNRQSWSLDDKAYFGDPLISHLVPPAVQRFQLYSDASQHHGLPPNLVQTFMSPIGWIEIILLTPWVFL